jgi:iron complex transport system ATP-binding protein
MRSQAHQLKVMELVQPLNRECRMMIIVVLHDLNQAARYAERMVVLKAGGIVRDGPPDETLIPNLLAEVFGVQANIIRDPHSGARLSALYAPNPPAKMR